jgi:hypothetical protein
VGRLRTVGIWTVAIALIGAIAYGELVSDWRIPCSDQISRFTVSVTHGMSLVDHNRFVAEMKEKYGARASTALAIDSGVIQVSLDGKVIETREQKKTLESVFGIFVIGPKEAVKMRFPFALAAKQDLKGLNRSVADWFKNYFKGSPKAWFEFSDKDWTIDRCVSLPAGLGLGAIGDALRLCEGTSCVVTWKGPQSGSMLISINGADGDPWMRPFARRLCRTVTEAALKRFNPEAPDSPKYAACILVDRPDYVSAQESLAIGVYSIGSGNALARME